MSSIAIIVYFGIAHGCNSAGWGFWRSFWWPTEIGRRLVATNSGGRNQTP